MNRLLIFLITVSPLLACNILGPSIERRTDSAQVIAEAEAFLGVSVPSDATNVHAVVGGFQDIFVQLRFDAPSATVESYIDALGIDTLEPVDAEHLGGASEAGEWWTPASVENPVGAESNSVGNSDFFRILIDQSNDQLWTVYIFAFST